MQAIVHEAPWLRQPRESAKAFAAFEAYRDLGPARSLSKACQALRANQGNSSYKPATKSAPGHWWAWSRDFTWAERARAYDMHINRQACEAHAETVRKLQEKHALQLKAAANKVILAINSADFEKLTAGELVRLSIEIIRMERLVHGEPVSVERHQHVGVDGGPIRSESTTFAATFQPSPQQMAEVMQILADHGGLDDPEADAPADAPALAHVG